MKGFLFVALVGFCSSAAAQEFEKTFYDADGKIVEESGSVYYKLTKESYSPIDTIKTFYTKEGSIRSKEVVDERGKKDGPSTLYYPNGNLKAKGINKAGKLNGEVHTWYADGKRQSVEYFPEEGGPALFDYWDPNGKQLVVNGQGDCECLMNIFSNPDVLEKGKVVDGMRESVWVGYRADGLKYFEETYEGGELKQGVSFDASGGRYKYDEIVEPALPIGGYERLNDHLDKNLKYPPEAKKNGVQGAVYVSFVVDENGYTSEFRIVKGVNQSLDDEAMRALKSGPRWTPETKRGQAIKTRVVFPIKFRLSYEGKRK
jgi:TonB family protein